MDYCMGFLLDSYSLMWARCHRTGVAVNMYLLWVMVIVIWENIANFVIMAA